jgi:putative membrane protein
MNGMKGMSGMPGMSTPKSLFDLGFFELWHPIFLVILLAIAALYLSALNKKGEPVGQLKPISFLFSLVFIYFSEGSPLSALGHHYSFSAHMLSMSITYFIFPPLFLGGLYEWMLLPFVKRPYIKRFINKVTNPLLAVSLFNILISFYHVPVIFNLIMSRMIYMDAALVILLFFAFVMWWVIMEPTPETRSISDLQKLGYVFVASVLLTPACAMITFADQFLYQKVAMEPTYFTALPPLQDQSTGGVIMKIVQELVFICTFGYIFYRWQKKDNPAKDNDLNPKLSTIKQNLPVFKK